MTPRVWPKTELSTVPAYQRVAHTDRRALSVTAGGTITGAAAVTRNVARNELVTGIVESCVVNGTNDGAVVTVSGFVYGTAYELLVTFTAAGGVTWPVTHVLDCIA